MTEGNKKPNALLGDAPVLEAGRRDHLRFESTARVLAGAAVETSYPLTIGIFGEWGTGRTSLMRLIEKVVTEDYKDAAAVWFNAWQYEKEEHLIVPLVATINKALETRVDTWSEELKKGENRRRDALRAIAYGFTVKGKIGIPKFSQAEVNLSPKDMIQRYQDLTKDTVLSRSLYFDAFEELGKCVENGKAPRILVFVDDLDRCVTDKAVVLLEGIKLVLHQPGLSFVLGVNEAVIHAFIKTKYEKEFHIRGSFFDDYLDKIVQVKIPVPKRESGDMAAYIGNLLEEADIFSEMDRTDAIPLIAEACKNNFRSKKCHEMRQKNFAKSFRRKPVEVSTWRPKPSGSAPARPAAEAGTALVMMKAC